MVNTRLLFVHALSPLHAGTGQGVGAIDLPVAREKATGLPCLPGSSLKGVLRDACANRNKRKRVFGPDTSEAYEHAGSVQIADQRLLLLPVRALVGTFAWVTSPYILRRFLRDAEIVASAGRPSDVSVPTTEASCLVSGDGCALVLNNQVVLEDLDLTPVPDTIAHGWARWLGTQVFPDDTVWQQILTARFCVVHDNVMSFLMGTATEVFARVKLREDAKTVEKGGLWYEEALPAETILSGLVLATPVQALPGEVLRTLADLIEKPLQLGGGATVGRGLCRLRMTGGN